MKLQKLRQKEIFVKDFTKEFYRLLIQLGHTNEGEEAVSRYLNGLKYVIQDELSLSRFKTVTEAYKLSLKAEENSMQKIMVAKGETATRGGSIVPTKGKSSVTKREFVEENR